MNNYNPYNYDGEEDSLPYDSLSPRSPLEDLSLEGRLPPEQAQLLADNSDIQDPNKMGRSPAGGMPTWDDFAVKFSIGRNRNDPAPLPNNPNSCLVPQAAPSPTPSPVKQFIKKKLVARQQPRPIPSPIPVPPAAQQPQHAPITINNTVSPSNSQMQDGDRGPAGQMSNPLDDPRISGLVDQYTQGENNLPEMRRAQLYPYLIQNMTSAAQQAAQGVQTPQPNNQLIQNMQQQNSGLMNGISEDLNRRQRIINAILLSQAKTQNNLNRINPPMTDNQKAVDARIKAGQDIRKSQIDTTNQNQKDRLFGNNAGKVNSLFNTQPINQEVVKVNSARGAQALIDDIRSGKLTDSGNIRHQLTNLMTKIELGGGAAQGDREKMGIDNAYTRMADLRNFITSNPGKTIPPAYLDQLESETHALGSRAMDNYKSNTDSVLSGASPTPENTNPNAGEIYNMGRQRQEQFLREPERRQEPSPTPSQGFPMKVRNAKGVPATVFNPQDLEAAKLKGFLPEQGR